MTTARTVLSVLQLSEAAWQRRVTETLTYYRWRWCHYRPARTVKGWRTPLEGHAGCPDLIIAGFGHVFVVELKTDAPSSRLTGDQQAWIDVGGNYAAVWRPRDWPFVLRFIQSRYDAVSPIPTGAGA